LAPIGAHWAQFTAKTQPNRAQPLTATAVSFGFLPERPLPFTGTQHRHLRRALRSLGCVEKQTIAAECRYAREEDTLLLNLQRSGLGRKESVHQRPPIEVSAQQAQWDRRRFVAVVMTGLLAAPRLAEAQKSEKMARLGILGVGPAPSPQELAKSVATNRFWISMRELGWVDGRNLIVERRFGESADQLRTGAADLVRLNVDVLFVASEGLAKILQLKTKTIPIVVGRAQGDLVAAGLVHSLAKPGGNITGSQLLSEELVAKRLQLLKALVPNLSKVALLREDVTTSAIPEIPARYDQQAVAAARALGVTVQMFNVHGAKDLVAAFPDISKNQIRGALVASSAFMFVHRQVLVDLTATHRIAAIYENELFVEIGGLMSYGVDVSEMQRRAATYVDKILRGARPANLPIEQPTKFNLVLNTRTAKALGLMVPQSLLLRADQVID
jgi:ABC-type uncharacterized transport system substrate-binding protein